MGDHSHQCQSLFCRDRIQATRRAHGRSGSRSRFAGAAGPSDGACPIDHRGVPGGACQAQERRSQATTRARSPPYRTSRSRPIKRVIAGGKDSHQVPSSRVGHKSGAAARRPKCAVCRHDQARRSSRTSPCEPSRVQVFDGRGREVAI